jgi:hypothetical protein
MAQFYRGNSLNPIGGPARVIVEPFTYAAPNGLDDIVDLTAYNLNPNVAYGWIELGLTDAATTFQINYASNQWRNEQFGLYRVAPTDWTGEAHSEFIEITQANRVNLLFGAAATAHTGQLRTNYSALTSIPYYRVAILNLDQAGRLHAVVFPKAQWDGSAVQSAYERGQPVKLPMTWRCFPDDATIDATTGLACIRYDLDSQ